MTHSVGDTVYADFGQYGQIDVRKGVVVRVTPTGQIAVDFGHKLVNGSPLIDRFKDGRMVGGGKWHCPRLIDEDRYSAMFLDMEARKLRHKIKSLLHDFCPATRAETIAALQAVIEMAEGLPE